MRLPRYGRNDSNETLSTGLLGGVNLPEMSSLLAKADKLPIIDANSYVTSNSLGDMMAAKKNKGNLVFIAAGAIVVVALMQFLGC